ncbi:MAG TPA: dienelactone hydrolase family protein [Candidatus Baltobacteraceae bacterium]|jgi:carboxymethylenebutenolidase|nr:dienelactone hydrolase family protein [Candidatus Baltobacteraceae bacterium]
MGQMIEFPRPDGASAPGYLALPEHPDAAPGIVLIEEWWGVNEQIKGIAERYAEHGYRTLVPDLFRGRVAADGTEAKHLMSGLDFADAASQDVRGSALHLRRKGGRVGVTGYCMGGALAILAAMHVTEIDAAVSFYGYPPADAGDPATIRIPLLCHAATHDAFFPIAGYEEIERKMKAAGLPVELLRYDAKHAFSNPTPPPRGLGNYQADLANLAWSKTLDFWSRTIGVRRGSLSVNG